MFFFNGQENVDLYLTSDCTFFNGINNVYVCVCACACACVHVLKEYERERERERERESKGEGANSRCAFKRLVENQFSIVLMAYLLFRRIR